MRFFDKTTVGQVNVFSHTDLLQYVESLMKDSTAQQPEGNYSWLRTRHTPQDYSKDLEAFKPMVTKMTSESCASIAVKLDNIIEAHVSIDDILSNFRRLLLEEHSMQLIAESTVRAKETKNRKRNRVHPDLGERQPIVSFILD